MAVFPKSQSNLYDLAMAMLAGFDKYGDLFPSVTDQKIQQILASFEQYKYRINRFEQAKAAARNATAQKIPPAVISRCSWKGPFA